MEQICKLADFETFFQVVKDDLPGKESLSSEYAAVVTRIKTLVSYSVPYTTKIKGYMVPVVFQCLAETNEEENRLSYFLGWCFQILQSYLTMLDDTVDQDAVRYGKLTWFEKEKKKRIVANDILLLRYSVFKLLYKYFGQTTLSQKLINSFNQLAMDFILGQFLTYNLSSRRDPGMAGFSMKNWHTCLTYTNKKYGFVGPFDFARILASESLKTYTEKGLDWGSLDFILELFAICWTAKNDSLDSFEVSTNPKAHNDIIKGVCKWLIVRTKEIATQEQWKLLRDSYGKEDPKKIQQVLKIYNELGVPEQCKEFVAETYKILKAKINELAKENPKLGLVLNDLLGFLKMLRE